MKKAKRLHRQLDEILEWKPDIDSNRAFKLMLLYCIPTTHEVMLEDKKGRA